MRGGLADVDGLANTAHHRRMNFSGTLRRATAACMLALLGVLGTGLPSHHHKSPVAAERADVSIAADHHAHGALLLEQPERLRSTGPQIAAPAVVFSLVVVPELVRVTRPADEPLRPLERAPPPGAPRAPPRHVV